MRTAEEIALNFDVPIARYSEDIEEAWAITKNEEKKKEVLIDRLNIVSRYQKKIYEGARELIDDCLILIASNKDMRLKDYFEEMRGTKFDHGREQENPWAKCLDLFLFHYDKMLFYENNEREGHCKYILNGDTVYRETTVDGETASIVEASHIILNYPAVAYCKYRGTFEYLLFHRLCDFISTKFPMGQWAKPLLAKLLLTVCLYIALQNEEDKLIEYASIFMGHFDQPLQHIATTVQANDSTPVPTHNNRGKNKSIPSVFISYSSGDEKHDAWVLQLADNLTSKAVMVYIDKYDIKPAQHIPHYIEDSIKKADKTLVIGTPEYKRKAEGQERGVGYEYSIISTEIMSKVGTERFIPILRPLRN